MILKYFLSGFFVKVIAGFDDTMTHIPIIGSVTKTKKGRIAFAIGMFLAISLVIGLSFIFASTIRLIPYSKYISACLIFILAFLIYFEVLVTKPKEKVKKELKKVKTISVKRFFKLIGVGFIAAFATIIDDTIAYSGLFLNNIQHSMYIIPGILIATILQLIVVVYFARFFNKIPHKRIITSIGLIILGILILLEII